MPDMLVPASISQRMMAAYFLLRQSRISKRITPLFQIVEIFDGACSFAFLDSGTWANSEAARPVTHTAQDLVMGGHVPLVRTSATLHQHHGFQPFRQVVAFVGLMLSE